MFNLNIFKNEQKEPKLSLKSNKNDKFWLSFGDSDQGIIRNLKCKYPSMVMNNEWKCINVFFIHKKCIKSLDEKNEIEMPNIIIRPKKEKNKQKASF